jgi:hypothetical protein
MHHKPPTTIQCSSYLLTAKLLLVFVSTVILGSESRETQEHIRVLLSHDSGICATLSSRSLRLKRVRNIRRAATD